MSFFARWKLRRAPRHDLVTPPPEKSRIQVQGAVMPAGGKVLVAPLTGRECIYYRVRFELYAVGERTDFGIERRCPFLVSVAGRRARVDPDEMFIEADHDTLQVAQRAVGDDFVVPPLLVRMVEERGLKVRRGLEITGIFAREAVIAVGEVVRVAGTVASEVDDEPGRGQAEGTYREPPRRVALRSPGLLRPTAKRPDDPAVTTFTMPELDAFS